MDLKVKDFASQHGVSESIIYRHIRQHKEALGDRVVRRGNATWLTDEGQDYIRGLMTQQPVVVGDTAQIYEVEELRRTVSTLQDKLIGAQERLLAAQEAINEGNAIRMALAAAETERDNLSKDVEKARLEAAEARQSEQEASKRIQELQSALEASEARERALKDRSWWQRLTRKGE